MCITSSISAQKQKKKRKKELKLNLSKITLRVKEVCSCAVAALWLGATVRVAAGPQAGICSFGDLTLSKHHAGFKLQLNLLDLIQHSLQVGSTLQREGVVLRGVEVQVEKERRVVHLEG